MPEEHRARLLFWGIVAALVLRGLAILGGVALIEQFHFVIYVLGVLLLVLAYRILKGVAENVDPDKNLIVRGVRRFFPVTGEYHDSHWFVKHDGTRYVTPLFLCLAAIVAADIAFAVDSIPAAFAITRDSVLIWMGNVFALLGLRALFVLVEGLIRRFRYLDETIAVVLAVVAVKLLIEDLYKIGPVASLGHGGRLLHGRHRRVADRRRARPRLRGQAGRARGREQAGRGEDRPEGLGGVPATRRMGRVCRLFALHAGRRDVGAEFWLLDAPTSLAAQSEVNADGFGLAALTADDGLLLVRNPVKAAGDRAYRGIARRAEACQFLVHLRYADTGGVSLSNTHPFLQDGRVFAHNGVVGDLERLEHRLGEHRAMVNGDTDSERVFALLTLCIRAAGGDVRAGIAAAVRELAEGFELYSINFVLGEVGHLWAFRYPEHNPLLVLEHAGGDGHELVERDAHGTLRMRADRRGHERMVVIASERMDADPGWEDVGVGELVHVGPDLELDRETVLTAPPRHQMVLSGRAEQSQAYERDA